MKIIYASLASGAAIGALLIACSSSTSSGVTPSPDSGAHTNPVDSGPGKDTGTAGDSGGSSSSSTSCPAPNAAAAVITWKAPSPISIGACSSADITAFTTSFNDQTQSFLQVYQSVSANCQKCMFSTQTDATWNTVVLAADIQTNPNDAFVNFGACYDLLYTGGGSGAAACGKGAQDDQFCLDAACPDACQPDDTTANACFTAATATGGECATYDTEETTGCGTNDDTLFDLCADPTVSIQSLCGSGAVDGGAADSGAD